MKLVKDRESLFREQNSKTSDCAYNSDQKEGSTVILDSIGPVVKKTLKKRLVQGGFWEICINWL